MSVSIKITRGFVKQGKWEEHTSGDKMKIEVTTGEYEIIEMKERLRVSSIVETFLMNENEKIKKEIDDFVNNLEMEDVFFAVKHLGLEYFNQMIEKNRKKSIQHWAEENDQHMVDFVNKDYNQMKIVFENFFVEDNFKQAIQAFYNLETAVRDDTYVLMTDEIKKIEFNKYK